MSLEGVCELDSSGGAQGDRGLGWRKALQKLVSFDASAQESLRPRIDTKPTSTDLLPYTHSGSTGPSSQWPHGEEGERWATRFPMVALFDMVRRAFPIHVKSSKTNTRSSRSAHNSISWIH